MSGEYLRMNESVRSAAPGKFIKLPNGLTHYELEGPENGIPIVLLNGFSIPLYLWDNTFTDLVSAGFRVLRFDFFGRGYSDRPDINYGPDLFDRQIVDILDALKINGPVNLIGSSMGGIVATIFADRHPEKVKKLVLINPAGKMDPPAFPRSTLNIPIIGEWVMHFFGEKVLLPGMQNDLYRPDSFPEYIDHYRPQMAIFGFKRAILSTFRSGMLYNQEEVYRRVGKSNLPILLLWGKEDQVIPFIYSTWIQEALPQAHFKLIEEAGHVPHYELPETVNPILIDFILS